MLIELKELSPVRRQAEIEIPVEAIASELDNVTGEFARQARVPGFRPGKVPIKVVRNRYQKEIESEALDRLIPKFFFEAVAEKVQPVGSPGVTNMGTLDASAPLRFTAEFEIRPVVELRDWKGLELSDSPTEVTEADVEAVIERLLDQSSTLEAAPERAAQEGDVLTVDIVSTPEGGESRTSEGAQIRLGDEAPMPEFNENLFGRNVGERVSFETTFGEDAPNEEVRGRKVQYEVTIRAIRTLLRPAADDEFARSSGMAETMADLRRVISEDLRRHKEQEARQQKREEAGKKLIEMHEIPTPQVMVQDELGKAMREYARYLQSRGVNLEYADVNWEEVQQQLTPGAENRVRRALILDAIAKEEGLSVSDTEVDAEIRQAASSTKQEFTELKHRLRHDGGYDSLRASMVQEKALEHVLNQAKTAAG